MNLLRDVIGTIPALDITPENGDYEQDGLLICGKCGAPRQVRIELFGQTEIKPCLCKCRAAAYERESAAYQAEREFEKTERIRAAALTDRTYREWTFDRDDGREPKVEVIRRYVDKWDEVFRKNIGLLLWGDVGTGKSFAAAAAINALTARKVPCMMTTFIRLANELSGRSYEDKNAFIASLNRYKLLVIDDLGAERDSPYMQEMVFEIIDARYRSGMPIIVTTNIPLEEIKRPKDITCSRIYDRLLEMTTPIRFTVKRRAQTHEAKREELLDVLGYK